MKDRHLEAAIIAHAIVGWKFEKKRQRWKPQARRVCALHGGDGVHGGIGKVKATASTCSVLKGFSRKIHGQYVQNGTFVGHYLPVSHLSSGAKMVERLYELSAMNMGSSYGICPTMGNLHPAIDPSVLVDYFMLAALYMYSAHRMHVGGRTDEQRGAYPIMRQAFIGRESRSDQEQQYRSESNTSTVYFMLSIRKI
ncbi:MAG: hypothetical protein Q9163_005979 [Psora crenata]